MKKTFFATIALATIMVATSAHSMGRHDNNFVPPGHRSDGGAGGAGGAGGRGGAGGDGGNAHSNATGLGVGVGVGVGRGGNARATGGNANARQGQLQGQQQGQVGINRSRNTLNGGDQHTRVDSSSRNRLNNNSSSRSGVRDSGNSHSSSYGGTQLQGQVGINKNGSVTGTNTNGSVSGSVDGNSSSVGNITINTGLNPDEARNLAAPDDNSVNVAGDEAVDASYNDNSVYNDTSGEVDIPVATAYAPALTTSNDTCMGSVSAGGQGMTFGFSIGGTYTDNDCILRKDARFIHNMGSTGVALSLMCGKESVRAAVARAGTPEQLALCAITEGERESYRARPVVVTISRSAPDEVEDDEADMDWEY